ncbi:cytosolic purine 5'-nucleotidase-like isoform X2 [Babylonia areolata]|uniref:cytosolic purine 5'-nucleotidase-like isoform X2 n=1 Tax=Babylonia areolata TaxID=304850 RepID=UPI003FD4029E
MSGTDVDGKPTERGDKRSGRMARSHSIVNPRLYKREPSKRVFVNRSLMLDKVKFFGFDMDYTLAVYKSPEYEELGFNLLKKQLVDMGYPQAISDFQYDPSFPIRGLWFDNLYGNLLKVDAFGNVLVCVTGFHFLKGPEIHKLYPNKYVQMDEARFHIFNTLYELPVLYILACLVDFFCNHPDYTKTKTGVKCGDLTMTFTSIYQDVLNATSCVHDKEGPLKRETVKNVEKYVERDERLPTLLDRLRSNGQKVFLATNSDYTYSNAIMSYIFDFPQPAGTEKRDWLSYFDYVVVDAKKPLFFTQGTILRQVDKETGSLKIGTHTGPISSKHVYSGGSVDVFSDIMGTYGHEVLYVGDHIFGDILKSRKARGWRTFLCVPELAQELSVWTEKNDLFARLEDFDVYISELYRNLDSSSKQKPDIGSVQKAIRDVTHEMDMAYGMLGSLFRTGSHQTFFASQVMRYADLYAASFLNLINYPLNYIFRAPAMLMPHESTVKHEDIVTRDMRRLSMCNRSRTICDTPEEETARPPLSRDSSVGGLPHPFAETPQSVTQVGDCLLEEDDGGESVASDSIDG